MPEPQLEFCRKLSLRMLENNLDDEGVSINYPIIHKKRSRGPGRPGHEIMSFPTHTGMWNTGNNAWTKTKTEYVKIKCATCKKNIITYCNCNNKVPMSTKCYGVHIYNCSNTNYRVIISTGEMPLFDFYGLLSPFTQPVFNGDFHPESVE